MFHKQQSNLTEIKLAFHGDFPQRDPYCTLQAFSQIRPTKDGEIQAYTFLVSHIRRIGLTKAFCEVAEHFRIDPRTGAHRFVEYLPPGNGQKAHIFSLSSYTWQWNKGMWINESPVIGIVSPKQQAEFEQLVQTIPPLWVSLHQDNPLGSRVCKEQFSLGGERYGMVWNDKGACIILSNGDYLRILTFIICFPSPEIALLCMKEASSQMVVREKTGEQALLPLASSSPLVMAEKAQKSE